ALIILNGRAGSPALPKVQGIQPQFMIECPGRGEYLGRGQWTQAESRLVPDAFSFTGETLILEVGPEVVDNLEALENYRFTLLFPGFVKSGALVCNNLIPSPMQSGRTRFGFEAEPQAVQGSPVPPNPPVQEQEAPLMPPQAAFSSAMPLSEPEPRALAGDAVPVSPQPVLNGEPVERPRSGKLPLIVAVAVILLLAGVAVVYFIGSGDGAATAPGGNETMQSEEAPLSQAGNASSAEENSSAESQEAPAETALPENQTEAGEMDAPTDVPQDVSEDGADEPAVPPAPEAPGALQSARELLRSSPGDDEIRRALSYMPLNEDNADGNFLLREELAQRGDAESMFLLAQFYDPVVNAPAGSIEKDAEQALYWYGQAKTKGWQSAAPAIEQLKTWLRDAAGQGNPEAARLLETLE
ncbi:MAG: hypothetical protein IJD04_01840, partial [Desulfovibrionaceae bacterium]|nr:hypothetical protein [Desulfovibrionaceae bacterium]